MPEATSPAWSLTEAEIEVLWPNALDSQVDVALSDAAVTGRFRPPPVASVPHEMVTTPDVFSGSVADLVAGVRALVLRSCSACLDQGFGLLFPQFASMRVLSVE
ncbi:hypothetical protein KDL01_24290, partial [Actinospica durhamensis]